MSWWLLKPDNFWNLDAGSLLCWAIPKFHVSHPFKICILLNSDVFDSILGELEELEKISSKAKAWMQQARFGETKGSWAEPRHECWYQIQAWRGLSRYFCNLSFPFWVDLDLTRLMYPGHTNIQGWFIKGRRQEINLLSLSVPTNILWVTSTSATPAKNLAAFIVQQFSDCLEP